MKGFDNVVSVKEMSEDDINHLESFVTSGSMIKCVTNGADMTEYFGYYCNNVQSFEIPTGHKKMLKEITRYSYDKYATEGLQFFDPYDNVNQSILKILCNRYENMNNDRRSKGIRNSTSEK